MSFLIVWGRCGEDRWRGDTSLFQVTHQLVPSGVIFVATLVSNDHIECFALYTLQRLLVVVHVITSIPCFSNFSLASLLFSG